MKKILVPTDFSACAQAALSSAVSLASVQDCEIHLLHITSVPADWLSLDAKAGLYADIDKKVKQANAQLEKLESDVEQKGVSASKHLLYNSGYQGILSHITDHNIDLVVMGSKGVSGLKEFVLGSNTQKIVRMSNVPVLVIKDQPASFPPQRIAFVSDFEEEVMDQFKLYVEWAHLWNAELFLLFVNTPSNFTDTLTTKIKMGNYALHAPGVVHNTYVFNDFNFEDGVRKFCQEHDIQMVGMITHGGDAKWQLFHNSLTEHMVNHLNLPILTLHFSPQED